METSDLKTAEPQDTLLAKRSVRCHMIIKSCKGKSRDQKATSRKISNKAPLVAKADVLADLVKCAENI